MSKSQLKRLAVMQAEKNAREAQDLRMMANDNLWPRWPMLPIKRRHSTEIMQCGLLYAGRGPVVYLLNMFSDLSKKSFDNAEQLRYVDFNALFDGGWRVD